MQQDQKQQPQSAENSLMLMKITNIKNCTFSKLMIVFNMFQSQRVGWRPYGSRS